MPNSRQPLFWARASYRKRRLRDGARLLPIFGVFLVLLPLLWPSAGRPITAHWAYVFAVWAGLIGIAALVSRKLVEADALNDPAIDRLGDAPLPPDADQGP